jgi:hypothetical protein
MKQNVKVFPVPSFIKALCLIVLAFAVTIGFAEPPKALAVGNVPDNIKSMMADYSQYLKSGNTLRQSFYSNTMKTLIQNRRDYYNELYDTGLHTDLKSIQSEFRLETANVTVSTNQFHVELLETVTMFGYPNLSLAEDYPMIPAARWAIANTNNDNVKQALERYIASTTGAVNYSITNGVETVFRVRHSIDISIKGGQLQFIKDEFTDKEVDNGNGFDNVVWANNNPVRAKVDLTLMPDYIIYHTPVEVLGQQLLDDYTRAYGETSFTPNTITSFTYNRTVAKNYALTYTSNTPYTTCTNIYQQTSYYNTSYQTMWNWTGCNDCADYVSQALRAGSFPTDSTWIYTGTDYSGAPGTYAWRVFDWTNGTWPNGTPKVGLAHYLKNIKQAIVIYTNYTSLLWGDLMYTNDVDLHVVMVTNVAPLKFSGHTNDRRDYPYVTSLQKFWHVKDTIP